MTRADQLRAATEQSLLESPCAFFTLLTRVQRAFPDALPSEVDQAAREWERGEPGRYVYSLEPLPEAQVAADRYAKAPGAAQLGLFTEEP